MDIHGKQNIVGTIWYGLGSKRGFNGYTWEAEHSWYDLVRTGK
jgi:hypothetical protein